MSRWPTTRGIFTPIGWPPGSDSSPSGHAVSFSSAGVREADHRPDLLRALLRQRLMEDLGDDAGPALELVDRTFAALAEPGAQADPRAVGLHHLLQRQHDRHAYARRREARTRVLSSSVRSLTGALDR